MVCASVHTPVCLHVTRCIATHRQTRGLRLPRPLNAIRYAPTVTGRRPVAHLLLVAAADKANHTQTTALLLCFARFTRMCARARALCSACSPRRVFHDLHAPCAGWRRVRESLASVPVRSVSTAAVRTRPCSASSTSRASSSCGQSHDSLRHVLATPWGPSCTTQQLRAWSALEASQGSDGARDIVAEESMGVDWLPCPPAPLPFPLMPLWVGPPR